MRDSRHWTRESGCYQGSAGDRQARNRRSIDNGAAHWLEPGYLSPLLPFDAGIKDLTVSEGSLTLSVVHPREAFGPAVRESAAAVIFVHNHPSGDPDASPEDRALTERLVSVGELVGIRVLDHVIIGDRRYVSFADQGWIRA